VLERSSLRGTVGYTGVDRSGSSVFRRTTCCLYYRLPDGGLCGDCALRP
jgi:ferric iron reductase protein FhuF